MFDRIPLDGMVGEQRLNEVIEEGKRLGEASAFIQVSRYSPGPICKKGGGFS